MAKQYIKIRGANEHNLKNVSLDIPRNELVVLTGLSGSGKSSLAFDTIYAEGQRRYMESHTCGLWAFIARCRSLWLRRWRGCDPPGASSDPAAVLLPSERVSPFRPLIGGNSTQLIPNFS